MQVLRLLAARRFLRRRRAVSTITATATAPATPCDDDGPFFDLDLSCCSAPASSAESSSESEDSSSCCGGGGEAGFVISLHRSCSASPSCRWAAPPPLKFCASEPNAAASSSPHGAGRRASSKLRTLSFGSGFYGGRASFSRSSTSNSARSAGIFASYGYGSPEQEEAKRAPSIRRYLSEISRRLRRVSLSPAAADLRLRKSRSASAAPTVRPRPSHCDDSLLEQQDGIASAIAHCKESLHRASMSECDSSLLRSRSDPGT